MKIKIKNDYWNIVRYSNKKFDKLFGKNTIACAHYHWRGRKKQRADLAFRPGKVKLSIIIHELTHAYMSSIDLYKVGSRDSEEIFCRVNEVNLIRIFLKALEIQHYLNHS